MANRSGTLVLAVVALLALSSVASAVPIFGTIAFTGTLDTLPSGTSLLTATGINFGCGACSAEVQGFPTGSYAGVADGTPVDFTNFTFNPFTPTISPLWEFSFAGVNYSFDLHTVSVGTSVIFGTNFLFLAGRGVAFIDDGLGTYDPTPATFSLTTQGNGTESFSFSANNEAVPEPGTLLLIGTGLTGLAVRRRKKA